jgi:hypothetical protein
VVEARHINQIYARSFQDSNGDGIGDLAGIRQRLDYLAWLGAIWISPIFTSPMADFGYDVSNYYAIDPIFGSLVDFDLLVRDAHTRGLKVILDYVPNHTSDQHAWFVASRASRTSAKRDWYIWRDGNPAGAPPNNWISQFGGSAWTFDQMTGQYYLAAQDRSLELATDREGADHVFLALRNDDPDRHLPVVGDVGRIERPTSFIEPHLARNARPDLPRERCRIEIRRCGVRGADSAVRCDFDTPIGVPDWASSSVIHNQLLATVRAGSA